MSVGFRGIHVCVGSTSDIDLLYESNQKKGDTTWPLPKNARIGDLVFFLAPAISGDLLAKGEVYTNPVKSKNWSGKYEAKIIDVSLLPQPISLEVLKKHFPEWGYLNYPRSYSTVPPEYVQVFDKIIGEAEQQELSFPEEVADPKTFYEGATKQVAVNVYERSPAARQACLNHYGSNCFVCGFNFEKQYGKSGAGFIHVHHLKPLSEIGTKYKLDPVRDLRPVCPNCHAMIHKRTPPYTIQEMKKMLSETRRDT